MISEIMTGLLVASGLYLMYYYIMNYSDWKGNGGGRKIVVKYK